jgi:hypothetical protein
MKKTTKAAAAVKAPKTQKSKQSYQEKATQQKAIVVAGVKDLETYQSLMCNPRWWAIPHINDVALLKKITETEKTPIIVARAKARIIRLEKHAEKVAAKADGKTQKEKPKAVKKAKAKSKK